MRRLDAHTHFWQYDPLRDAWIGDDMRALQRDFLPQDLSPLLSENGFEGCIAVQADQSETENDFLLQLAQQHPCIKGVVGWIDLLSPAIEDKLQQKKQQPLLKGFRHILQGERHRQYMLRPAFLNGVKALGRQGYSYDILIYPDQLGYALPFARCCNDQKLVIDHIAKPAIGRGERMQWEKEIRAFTSLDHVYCKLSGIVTECDWKSWNRAQIAPYLETVLETFGADRLLFGSDWPVCLLAAGYGQVAELAASFLSEAEQQKVFRQNIQEFYNC